MPTSSTQTAFRKTTTAEPCPPSCIVCLEPLSITPFINLSEQAVTINKCGHIFGYECLTTWMRDHNTCPVCRVEFFALPESSVGSDAPQHFVLGVYTLANSRLEVAVEGAVQGVARLSVDNGHDAYGDGEGRELARRD